MRPRLFSLLLLCALMLSACNMPATPGLIPTEAVHKAPFIVLKPTADLPAGDGLPAMAEAPETADLATATLPYLIWTATPEPTATATFTPEPTATTAPGATPAPTDPGQVASDRTRYT